MTTALTDFPESNNFCAVRSFPAREQMIAEGLRIYLRCTVGEFFTDAQLKRLTDTLSALRTRPAEGAFPVHVCKVVSPDASLSSRFIPRKRLRKDEMSVLIYNLAPYAFMNRKEAAIMAKACFPRFFSSSATVNSTFTKFLNAPITGTGREIFFTITNFPFHSNVKLEEEFIKLAIEYNTNQ